MVCLPTLILEPELALHTFFTVNSLIVKRFLVNAVLNFMYLDVFQMSQIKEELKTVRSFLERSKEELS